jgi:hypothetical protein
LALRTAARHALPNLSAAARPGECRQRLKRTTCWRNRSPDLDNFSTPCGLAENARPGTPMAGPSLPPAAGSINSILAAPAQFLIDARSEAWHHYALCNQCADRRNARGAALHSQRWAWRHTSGRTTPPEEICLSALDRRHLGRRTQGARQQLAPLRGKRAGRRQHARPTQLAHRHVRACRRERAYADVKFGLENFKRYFSEVANFPIIPPDVTGDPVEYLVSTGLACTPEDCVRHFERLWKGSDGGLGGILLLAHNWADWAATKRSYELMARYVHPQFEGDANALRQWSYDDASRGTRALASRHAPPCKPRLINLRPGRRLNGRGVGHAHAATRSPRATLDLDFFLKNKKCADQINGRAERARDPVCATVDSRWRDRLETA